MSGDNDYAGNLDLLGMLTVCHDIAGDVKDYPDEKRRAYAILVYRSADALACSLADAVIRESGQPAPSFPSEEAALALVCHHPTLVGLLRAAGYEISDAEDPGPGRMAAVFIANDVCERQTTVIDPVLVAEEAALTAALEALPEVVLNAASEGVKLAVGVSDTVRRRQESLVVCECDDAKAWEVIRTMAHERQQVLDPTPGKAATLIYPHEVVARAARTVGYAFTDVPPPRIGWMRVFIFTGGKVLATVMRIQHEDEVARAQEQERQAGEAFAQRIYREKQRQISRAVGALIANPELRMAQLVVVFGSPTATVRAVYREIAALPGMVGFPNELPEGAPTAIVNCEVFLQILQRHGVDAPDIDVTKLGPNQVHMATFTPHGIYVQKIESLAISRGGTA